MILERCKWRMFWETNTSVYLWYINVQLTHPSSTDDWLLTSGTAPPASEAMFMFLTFSRINCILVFDAEIQSSQCSGISMEFWSMRFSFPTVVLFTWPKSQISLKQVRFERGVMGERRRGVFSIFTTLEGSKIHFLLLFWRVKIRDF